jgi:hypothetical protein
MTDTIAAGSIWMEAQTHLPNSIRLRGERDASGWTALNGTRSAFEKEVQEAGWTLFFMAGAIQTTVFGFDKQKALLLALQRLIVKVKSSNCNGIEISQVTAKSFLKMSYVTVSAHARHLQSGSTFSGQTFRGSI